MGGVIRMKNKLSLSDTFSIIVAILAALAAGVVVSLAVYKARPDLLEGLLANVVMSMLGATLGLIITFLVSRSRKGKKGLNIFLSHRYEDRVIVDKLANRLRNSGYTVFDPKTMILPGDSITSRVEEGIRESDLFIILLSDPQPKSLWGEKELNLAMKHHRTVIPLVTQDGMKLPDAISDNKYLVLSESTYDNTVNELLAAIRMRQRSVTTLG